jgi:Cu/Ag efflux protein CusF
MKRLFAVSVLGASLLGAASLTSAQMKGMDMKDMDMKGTKKGSPASHHATGKVKSVDAANGTVTIDHGPVASMKWPAMTMTFKAREKALLQNIKPGQQVEFDFEQHGKDHVITKVK